jgi:hypothetical protein
MRRRRKPLPRETVGGIRTLPHLRPHFFARGAAPHARPLLLRAGMWPEDNQILHEALEMSKLNRACKRTPLERAV